MLVLSRGVTFLARVLTLRSVSEGGGRRCVCVCVCVCARACNNSVDVVQSVSVLEVRGEECNGTVQPLCVSGSLAWPRSLPRGSGKQDRAKRAGRRHQSCC